MEEEAGNRSSVERAIDVLIIIAAGIAMVLGLLLLTWMLAKIFDNCCCCCLFSRPLSSTADREFDRGPVSRKAGLWGLLQTERTQILQHLFQPIVWSGNGCGEGEEEQANSCCQRNDANTTDAGLAVDDAQHRRVCCICLNPYEANCQVMTGKTCLHMYHYDCCMKWLKRHDECPYCRQELMTGQQFRQAAVQLLGEDRVRDLSGAWLYVQEGNLEGENNDNNFGSSNDESENDYLRRQQAAGDSNIEMGSVASVRRHEASSLDIEAQAAENDALVEVSA